MNTDEKDLKPSLEPSLGLDHVEIPSGVDRRAFMMRSALVGAVAVLNGLLARHAARRRAAAAPRPAAAQARAPACRRTSTSSRRPRGR